jgi:hypothetical protein
MTSQKMINFIVVIAKTSNLTHFKSFKFILIKLLYSHCQYTGTSANLVGMYMTEKRDPFLTFLITLTRWLGIRVSAKVLSILSH